jgi:hypothetical protein
MWRNELTIPTWDARTTDAVRRDLRGDDPVGGLAIPDLLYERAEHIEHAWALLLESLGTRQCVLLSHHLLCRWSL